MQKFDLYQLPEQVIGISKAVGNFLGEAAQICLELNGHTSGVQVNLSGLYEESITLEWDKVLEEDTLMAWKDVKEATEYGATAISLLLILYFGEYQFAERLPQIAVGDYFLKKSALEHKNNGNEAFLEISGIYQESTSNTLNVRISQKRKQLQNKPTDNKNVLISVVEFATPKAKIVKL
ncbi:MAG: hypothetical protein AAFO82_10895 [Bacteroidota bacterium]